MRTRARWVSVVVVGFLAAFLLVSCDGGAKDEVFLEPIADVGADPFGQSAAEPAPPSTISPDTPISIQSSGGTPVTAPTFTASSGGAQTLSGGTPGLYGGTKDQKSCDAQKMIDYLLTNPEKALAWATVHGISVPDIQRFVAELTPVLLRSDTRVTNHGFKNGKATAKNSVLQAGTAVLVDKFGDPKARCACGNPLLSPKPAKATFTGTKWPGFNPNKITVIQKNTTVINVITVINVVNGEPFGKTTGGGPDVPLPPGSVPGGGSSTTATTGTTSLRTTTTAAGPTGAAGPITGYWTGAWGNMILQERAGGGVVGVYPHDTGSVSGTYNAATRTFTGWWCEAGSRQPPSDAGDVEFTFSGPGPDGLFTTLDGRWRYGTSGSFSEDWDLTRAADQPPAELVASLQTTPFCPHP